MKQRIPVIDKKARFYEENEPLPVSENLLYINNLRAELEETKKKLAEAEGEVKIKKEVVS